MQKTAWDASSPNSEGSSKQSFPCYLPSVFLNFRPVSSTHKIVDRALLVLPDPPVATTRAAG